MAHYLGDTIESVVTVINAAGSPVSGLGAGVTAALYNPLDVLDGVLVVSEIGATGRYRCEFTKNLKGAWKVFWDAPGVPWGTVDVFDLVEEGALFGRKIQAL